VIGKIVLLAGGNRLVNGMIGRQRRIRAVSASVSADMVAEWWMGWCYTVLIRHRHLILLQPPIRHLEGPDPKRAAVCERRAEHAEHHPAAQPL
jgi:hypothetical protein